MNETVKIIFGLAGGLALFLYGMSSMSDALQKTAGEKMKNILGFLTKNPVMGALAGALVTAVLQSSSATTVMVIGFVSAGLMSLPQAISVIFGANIGTTMTAQLIAFQISDYIYPIIFIGFILNFVAKKEKIKNIGLVIFSFGLLFEGIEIMGSVMKPLANSPVFIDLMGKVADIPVLGVLLGTVMTMIVQSSSATIAVLQNFAAQAGPDGVTSIIGLAGAIPILLGNNIGTTITALLASVGQSKNAKRTAIAHTVFNLTGSVLFLFLIPLLTQFVTFISPTGIEVDVISRQIANAHTIFNVVCTLIWLPLIPVMVKIVKLLIPGQDSAGAAAFQPKFLDDGMIGQPAAAMYLVSQEMKRLMADAGSMLSALKDTISGEVSSTSRDTYLHLQQSIKKLHASIARYITKLFSSGNLTASQSDQIAGFLYVSNNGDRIADRCEEISDSIEHIRSTGRPLSEEASGELNRGMRLLGKLYRDAMGSLQAGNLDVAQRVVKHKNKIRKIQKQLNKAHLARVNSGECDAALTSDFSNILYNLDRIADNCVGIAEEAMDHVALISLPEPEPQELPEAN